MNKKSIDNKRIEISEKNPSIKLAVYGTLREGRGNWKNFLRDKSRFLGTIKTEPSFTLYGKNWNFPIAKPEGNTSIECDIFEITNPAVLEKIHMLENCTGIPGHEKNWYDIISIETQFGVAYMYIQNNNFPDSEIIFSGNWNHRKI